MKAEVLLQRLLLAGALLEGATAMALLIYPSAAVGMLLGQPLDTAGLVISRVAAGALLAVATACWFARFSPRNPTSIGVARGLLVYNLVAALVLAHAGLLLGAQAPLLWPVVVLHMILTAALLVGLSRLSR